jgi:fibronectin-binding autotransporter adhesin
MKRTFWGMVALVVGAGSAFGQTWNGAGPNDNWTTGGAGGNWSGAAAPVSSATTALIFNGNTRLTPTNDNAGTFTLNTLDFAAGAGAFVLGGNDLSFGGATRSITSATSANVAINNSVSFTGSGTVNANGTGAITFGGASVAFAGTTTFGQGTINLNGTTNTAGNIVLGNGGVNSVTVDTGARTLVLSGNIFYDGGINNTGGAGWLRGTIDLNGAARAIDAFNPAEQSIDYSLVVSAVLTGTGSSGLIIPNTHLANLVLNGQSTYSGPTTINNDQGSVYLGTNNALPTTTALTLGFNAYLSLGVPTNQTFGNVVAGSYNHQVGSLASTFAGAEVHFGNTTVLTVGDATNTTYAGILTQRAGAGTPQLVKTGAGTLTLSGNSSAGGFGDAFAGTTTVNQGTLAVRNVVSGAASGTGKSTVTVAAGGTLAGNGSVVPDRGSQAANTVTINGTVAPDSISAAIGTLTIGANSSRASVTINGTYRVDLLANGTSDRLTINGSLALGANSVLNASGISSTPGGGSFVNYTIATFDNNGLTGTFDVANSSIPTGSSIQYGTTNIVLVVPVPEPATVLGLSALALGGAGFVRRRFTSRPASPRGIANTTSMIA